MLSSFNNDPARLQKSLEESVFPGQYHLNTPGQGTDLPFFNDPQIRLQKWGANLMEDRVNLESDLHGLTRTSNKGNTQDYKKFQVKQEKIRFRVDDSTVFESRATDPAFLFKEKEITNYQWDYPLFNPQNHTEKKFHTNIQTRILERDFFEPTPYQSANDFAPLLPSTSGSAWE